MNKILQSTILLTYPNFFKGASRIVDLSGQLDEYATSSDADYVALKNDWKNVGKTISKSIGQYVEHAK